MNLTSSSDDNAIVERHVQDSLQLTPLAGSAGTWVDVGTGGGFPGAILAAAFAEDGPAVTLVESNTRKAAFLRAACVAMEVSVDVLAERAERVVERLDPPSVVSARAVASLNDLLGLLAPWLGRGTRGVFPKGRDAEREIMEARDAWDFDVRRHPSTTAPDATILEIVSLRPKMAGFAGS